MEWYLRKSVRRMWPKNTKIKKLFPWGFGIPFWRISRFYLPNTEREVNRALYRHEGLGVVCWHWVSFRTMFHFSSGWRYAVSWHWIRLLTQRPRPPSPCKMLLALGMDHPGLNLSSPTYRLQCLDKVLSSLSHSFLTCKVGLVRVSFLQDRWGH